MKLTEPAGLWKLKFLDPHIHSTYHVSKKNPTYTVVDFVSRWHTGLLGN